MTKSLFTLTPLAIILGSAYAACTALAHAALAWRLGETVGVFSRVCMSPFALRLSRHVVRPVRDAVELVVGICAHGQSANTVVSGVTVDVPDLQFAGVTDEGGMHQAMYLNEPTFPVLPQSDAEVPALVRVLGQDDSGALVLPTTRIIDDAVHRSDTTLIRDFVMPISPDQPPFLHLVILTEGG